MPTEAEHDDAYQDNLAALQVVSGQNPRWAAVVAFYAAVHLVERLAARDGVHNIRHTNHPLSRQVYLSSHAAHSAILADFTALRSASEVARYHSLGAFAASYPGNVVQTTLIQGCLRRIEQHVAAQVAPPPPPPPATPPAPPSPPVVPPPPPGPGAAGS